MNILSSFFYYYHHVTNYHLGLVVWYIEIKRAMKLFLIKYMTWNDSLYIVE